jgi:hypothetical protein
MQGPAKNLDFMYLLNVIQLVLYILYIKNSNKWNDKLRKRKYIIGSVE